MHGSQVHRSKEEMYTFLLSVSAFFRPILPRYAAASLSADTVGQIPDKNETEGTHREDMKKDKREKKR
jgi:hypothetical protein